MHNLLGELFERWPLERLSRFFLHQCSCKAYVDLEAEAGAMTAEEGKAMCEAVIREWNQRVRERWPAAILGCPQCLAHMLLHGRRNTGVGLRISCHIILQWLVFPNNNGKLREVIVTMSSTLVFQYRTKAGMLMPRSKFE